MPVISVTISPSTTQTVEQKQPLTLTAQINNDTSGKGVTWTIVGTGCSGAACGALTNVTSTSALYTGPSAVTTNVQVFVSAMSVADPTKSAKLLINLVPPPYITTGTLPNGSVGVAYTTQLTASGGIGPYTWDFVSGKLPQGLSLSASGTISGTPLATSVGTSYFTVRVTDSFGLTYAAMLNSTIVAPNLLITTLTPLPGGTLSEAYSTTIQAEGGVKPYTFAVMAGALPSGLALSSGGVISGAPAATGTASFTIQVTDSTLPRHNTASASYTLMIIGTGGGINGGLLTGHYAFQFTGFVDGALDARTAMMAAEGSFTADGAGNIVDGIEDLNTPTGAFTSLPLSGKYTIGTDNRGQMTLNTALGSVVYSITVGSVQSGVARRGKFIEFDDDTGILGTRGTGTLEYQDVSVFNLNGINGGYAFGIRGETPCHTCATLTDYGEFSGAGVVSADGLGNFNGGEADTATGSTSSNNLIPTGMYSKPSATNGRYDVTLSLGGYNVGGFPQKFVLYIISSDRLYLQSTDSHASTTLVSGVLQRQATATFSDTYLSGAIVAYETSRDPAVEATNPGRASDADLLMMQGTVSPNDLKVTTDSNHAGVVSSNQDNAEIYSFSVAANGRVSLDNGTNTAPILYLYTEGSGFGTEQPAAPGDRAGLMNFELQTGNPFFFTPIYGSFSFASLNPPVTNSVMQGGFVTVGAEGGVNVVTDTSDSAGHLVSGSAFSGTISNIPNNGRVTLTSGRHSRVIYLISGTRFVMLETDAGDVAPTIEVADQ
jgi:large repetitive protein